jgi:hypothetical protein
LQCQPHPQQHGGGQPQRPPAVATYQEFLSTQPPLFTKAEDPLDAEVWLRVVESKFPLLAGDCPDDTKARFTAQQLHDPARTWWDHFRAMLPADHEVSWEEFKNAFRGHHIPAGILDRKLNEFLALNQGTRTVLQYAQAFNDLCQYAGYHADSDEKKRDRFRRGLNSKLRERLNTVRADSFNELVNLAISQEDCIVAHWAEKKRKAPMVAPLRSSGLLPTIRAGISAAGRQMGDQATSAAAAAGTHSFSSSRSKEQSASSTAVLPGKWEQVLHLWQCGPLCQELPKKLAESYANTKSRQGKKAEGTSQAREAQLHYSGGVT